MSYSLGVDLGTTFLAAAVAGPTGVRMVTLGDQTVVAPAVVDVTDDGIRTGSAAERQAAGHPDRLGRELKRRLGDPNPVRLGGNSLAPGGGFTHPVATLLGAQLRDVVARVVDIEGGRPERVVLTHPASWSRYRREQFDEVARAAGLEAPQTVTEAEAAVSSALAGRLRDGEVVGVYDLGGGTLEAAVVRKQADGLEILGAEGMDRIGGVDFDGAILSHIDHVTGGALSAADRDDPQAAVALARLRQDCVAAKEALSLDTETVVPVLLPGWHVEVRLTRWAFEEMVRPGIATTMGALQRAVRSAGLISSDLSAVLLMGGSSRIPLVTQMLSQEFGRPTVQGVHPKYPVALGAATIAPASVAVGSVPAGSFAPGSAGGYADVGPPAQVNGNGAPDPADPAEDSPGVPVPSRNGAGAYPDSFDPPTQMLVVPRHEPDPRPLVPAGDPHSRGPRRRFPLAALAAAAAVLVLALVYLLAPGPPAVAPAAPAAPTTSAPATTTSATAPASTATTSTTAATSTTSTTSTTAAPTTSSTARRSGPVQRTRSTPTSSRPRRSGG